MFSGGPSGFPTARLKIIFLDSLVWNEFVIPDIDWRSEVGLHFVGTGPDQIALLLGGLTAAAFPRTLHAFSMASFTTTNTTDFGAWVSASASVPQPDTTRATVYLVLWRGSPGQHDVLLGSFDVDHSDVSSVHRLHLRIHAPPPPAFRALPGHHAVLVRNGTDLIAMAQPFCPGYHFHGGLEVAHVAFYSPEADAWASEAFVPGGEAPSVAECCFPAHRMFAALDVTPGATGDLLLFCSAQPRPGRPSSSTPPNAYSFRRGQGWRRVVGASKEPAPTALQGATFTAWGERAVLYGPATPWLYDIPTGAWTGPLMASQALPPRTGHAAAVVGDWLYLMGGCAATDPFGHIRVHLPSGAVESLGSRLTPAAQASAEPARHIPPPSLTGHTVTLAAASPAPGNRTVLLLTGGAGNRCGVYRFDTTARAWDLCEPLAPADLGLVYRAWSGAEMILRPFRDTNYTRAVWVPPDGHRTQGTLCVMGGSVGAYKLPAVLHCRGDADRVWYSHPLSGIPARAGHSMAVLGSTLLILGGDAFPIEASNDLWHLDLEALNLTHGAPCAAERIVLPNAPPPGENLPHFAGAFLGQDAFFVVATGNGTVVVHRLSGCPIGTALSADTGICEACAPGSYVPLDHAEGTGCRLCPAGTYLPYSGMFECRPCDPAHYSAAEGQMSPATCSPCPLGTYAAEGGLPSVSACRLCPAGTHGVARAACTEAQGCRLCTPEGNATFCGLGALAPTRLPLVNSTPLVLDTAVPDPGQLTLTLAIAVIAGSAALLFLLFLLCLACCFRANPRDLLARCRALDPFPVFVRAVRPDDGRLRRSTVLGAVTLPFLLGVLAYLAISNVILFAVPYNVEVRQALHAGLNNTHLAQELRLTLLSLGHHGPCVAGGDPLDPRPVADAPCDPAFWPTSGLGKVPGATCTRETDLSCRVTVRIPLHYTVNNYVAIEAGTPHAFNHGWWWHAEILGTVHEGRLLPASPNASEPHAVFRGPDAAIETIVVTLVVRNDTRAGSSDIAHLWRVEALGPTVPGSIATASTFAQAIPRVAFRATFMLNGYYELVLIRQKTPFVVLLTALMGAIPGALAAFRIAKTLIDTHLIRPFRARCASTRRPRADTEAGSNPHLQGAKELQAVVIANPLAPRSQNGDSHA